VPLPVRAPTTATVPLPLVKNTLDIGDWDGWLDGKFECEFMFGKRLHQDCLGIIECDNPDCTITV